MGYNHRGPRGRGWIKLKSLAKGSPTVFIALNISLSVLRSTSPFISLLFILFSFLLHHTLFSRFLPDSIRYASHLDLCYCRRRHLFALYSRSLPSLCHSLLTRVSLFISNYLTYPYVLHRYHILWPWIRAGVAMHFPTSQSKYSVSPSSTCRGTVSEHPYSQRRVVEQVPSRW